SCRAAHAPCRHAGGAPCLLGAAGAAAGEWNLGWPVVPAGVRRSCVGPRLRLARARIRLTRDGGAARDRAQFHALRPADHADRRALPGLAPGAAERRGPCDSTVVRPCATGARRIARAHQDAAGDIAMRMVNCVLLKKEAPGLDRPPYPGDLGKRVYENVSKEA